MAPRKSNPDFLNGVPELLILKLLAHRPMHGYQLVQAIRCASNDELQFGEGCIYPLLHRLEKEGVLSSRREQVNGRDRLVYRTTKAGTTRLAKTALQWRSIVTAVAKILDVDFDSQVQGSHGGSHGRRVAGTTA